MNSHDFELRYNASRFILAAALFFYLAPALQAVEGDPLAIRTWPGGVVSIETHWDFEVVVNLGPTQTLPEELSQADLLIARAPDKVGELQFRLQTNPRHEVDRSDGSAEATVSQWPILELGLRLDRHANSSIQTLLAQDESTSPSNNAVSISHIADRLLLLTVDGVCVAIPLLEQFASPEGLVPINVLVLSPLIHDSQKSVPASALDGAKQLAPRSVVLSSPLVGIPTLDFIPAIGNTLAVRHIDADADATRDAESDSKKTRWYQLGTVPWQMPAELSGLVERKELACRQSQRTFAKLSVSQLNFKPANGTHTPRWNCEHMMGRELLFFSQIFAERSPALRVIDLNPKQMPPDYRARHADWDGREEARQMERVASFTRRFAYLLDELNLDDTAPGSTWTLRKLLKQMEAHYSEHTANVIKKFELPDWPTH